MKAIKMDIVQIGEHCNALSHETQNKIQKFDLKGVINLRNFIARGYTRLKKILFGNQYTKTFQGLLNS